MTKLSQEKHGVVKNKLEIMTKHKRYSYNLISRFGSSLIAYWPLWESINTTGSNSVKDQSSNLRNGTPTDVTFGSVGIGDKQTSASFNGASSLINVYSTSLRDAFNGSEGTVVLWLKVPLAAWSDASRDDAIMLYVNGSNFVSIRKATIANRLELCYTAGAVGKTAILTLASTGWFCVALTWSKSNDRVRAYINGIQHGEDFTGLGVWAGTLSSTYTVIGHLNTTAGTNPWNGQIAHVVLLNREATPNEIAAVSQGAGYHSLGTGCAMICFDDGYSDIYGGLTYLKNCGKVATVYMVGNQIDGAVRLTSAQLQEMDTAGFAIGNHTRSHTNLTTLTEAQQEAELSGGKTDLETFGLTRASRHVAYPNGASNADTLTAMTATGMLTGRTVDPATYVNPATMVLYAIPTTSTTIVTSTPLLTLENIILLAVSQGLYGILLFHELADAPTNGEYSNANFQKLIDWIVGLGISTRTIIDLYNARP